MHATPTLHGKWCWKNNSPHTVLSTQNARITTVITGALLPLTGHKSLYRSAGGAKESDNRCRLLQESCRPCLVQTVSVHGTNAICTRYECRLINRNFTTLKTYNLELLSIKYRETLTKTGWKVINSRHWKITNWKVLGISPSSFHRTDEIKSTKFSDVPWIFIRF